MDDLVLDSIANKHQLHSFECIDGKINIYHCKHGDTDVVLKLYTENSRSDYLCCTEALRLMKNYKFQDLQVPGLLHADSMLLYIIMTYEAGKQLQWTEKDGDNTIGSASLSRKDQSYIFKILCDLAIVKPVNSLWVQEGWEEDLKKRLDRLGDIIPNDIREKAKNCITTHSPRYYEVNTVFSNGDLYARNILINPQNNPILVDWDKAHISTIEQELMYVWVHNFGNSDLQTHLLEWYRDHYTYDKGRLQIGLIFATLHLIEIWCDTKSATQGLAKNIGYLSKFESLN